MIVSRRIIVVGLPVCLLLAAAVSSCASPTAVSFSYPDYTGPFLDKVVYSVIEGDDQQVFALLNNDIDLIGDMVDPSHLSSLNSAEDVEVASVLRNGYGYITIKTDKYPFNITDFRRAFAFAMDKERISDDVWDGLSVPQDSCVAQVNPLSIEGQLPYNYYQGDVALGNQLLDAAGFLDIDNDTIREAPDGSEFDVLVESASSSSIAIEVGAIAAEALVALHIDGRFEQSDYYEGLNRLYFHGDFDMYFLGSGFTDFDVDWLAYEFWSEYADEAYSNYPCWRNATYDGWRDQLLHSTEYDEVYEAAMEMQRIWVHACPMVVCYENVLLSAYRTDTFVGHINDVIYGVSGWWTNYRVHLKGDNPFGGTFRWSNPLDLDTFNFMVSSSAYTRNVLDELYDSLIIQDPEGVDMMWLAESYVAETHADNPEVPAGRTRFTFHTITDATWTDGTPLTAEDVVFSLNYYRDAPGNPLGVDLAEMTTAYAANQYTAVVELSTESYWHLHTIGYKPIIPEHVFESVGLDGWNTWNPQPPDDEMVTSGPFNVSRYVAGEFCELTYNPGYFHGVAHETNYPPTLSNPAYITYNEGDTGNQIVWHAYDTNPTAYAVFCNRTVYDSGIWSGSDIAIDVDGLEVGTYNFTLRVVDMAGVYAVSSVWVFVVPRTHEWTFGIMSPLSLAVTLSSVTLIIVVLGLTLRKKP